LFNRLSLPYVDCSSRSSQALYLRRHGDAITLLGLVDDLSHATDIFPECGHPVISVIWQFPGMSPGEMVRPDGASI